MAGIVIHGVRLAGSGWPVDSGRADALHDVRIGEDGSLAAIAPSESASSIQGDHTAHRICHAEGAWLSPGWVDIHSHVYYGATDMGVHPATIGPATGVTTLVDCGSAGEANWEGFSRFVASRAGFPIVAFLNVGSIGLTACNRVSELQSPGSIDLARIARVVEEDRAGRHLIRGLKARVSGTVVGGLGLDLLKLAKKAARMLSLPLVVHVGEPPPLLEDIVDCLDEGDMVTHCYHGKPGGSAVDDPLALAAVRRAVDQGVRLDVGHGAASFSFDVAGRLIGEGIRPFSISTDLHRRNVSGPVWDLATTMTKLLAAGLPVEEVIDAVSVRPSEFLGMAPGHRLGETARLTLFSVVQVAGGVPLEDSTKAIRIARQVILPLLAIYGAQVVHAATRFPPLSVRK